jgi:hypothetical protein
MRLAVQHDHEIPLGDRITGSLVRQLMDTTCRRHSHPGQATAALARIERLIAAEAWAEVALALIDLELPEWQLRRLAYDGGEWHCALSRRRELPDWLDQAVEASHPDLPGALLEAFLGAQRIVHPLGRPSVPSVPRESAPCTTLCCDNFA